MPLRNSVPVHAGVTESVPASPAPAPSRPEALAAPGRPLASLRPGSQPAGDPFAPPIYLDHNASTPVDPRVRAAMLPYLSEDFGNPASRTHVFGRHAEHAVEVARQRVATLIGASDLDEISFTSGATQSNALAILTVARAQAPVGRNHIITSAVEHQSQVSTCDRLAREGFEVTRLPVDARGRVNPEDVSAAITDRTCLVSIMLAQNVIGTIQPIAEIGAIARGRGVPLHVDAAQGVGLVPFDVEEMQVDLASLSAHKLHGPKGIGALYVRERLRRAHAGDWTPPGTLNVPAIVGFGRAAEIMRHEGADEARRLCALRDRLYERLARAIPLSLNGPLDRRHPGNLNVSIPGLLSTELAALRTRIAISHGSACGSQHGASHVLLAIGLPEEQARTALRIGLGRFSRVDEVDTAADLIIAAVRASEQRALGHTRGGARVVINCEGRRVRVAGDDDSLACAAGSREQAIAELAAHSLPALHALARPPRMNIVIPSHGSGPQLGRTLLSLLSKIHAFRTDLIVFVNEPPNAAPWLRRANDETETWLRQLIAPGSPAQVPERFAGHHERIRALLAENARLVQLRCVRQTLSGGMPAVYRAILGTFVHRLREHSAGACPDPAPGARLFDELCRRTFVLICDDDVQLDGDDALERAYRHATVHDAVVLGQLVIERLPGQDAWDDVLCDVFQVFLDVKQSLDANALSPRGLLVKHLLEEGPIDLDDPFGDQLYFARLAAERPRFTLTGRTVIREADYPSNGRLLRDLKRYLQGADNDALSIFRNVLDLVRASPAAAAIWAAELERFLAALKSRDQATIAAMARALVRRTPRQRAPEHQAAEARDA